MLKRRDRVSRCHLGVGGAPPELEEPPGTFMVSSTAAHRQPVLSRYL